MVLAGAVNEVYGKLEGCVGVIQIEDSTTEPRTTEPRMTQPRMSQPQMD